MKRSIMDELLKWKEDAYKKAMLITGARQIGKTYSIREFGRLHYEHFVEINFVENQQAYKIFEMARTAEEMITNLTAFAAQRLVPGKTLIFLDEIQECPQARTAIKFLVDDGRFDYIESGSLLGVKTKEVKSYPVGYEKICQMYPMSLEEFFIANGVQEETIAYLKACYENNEPVRESVHDTMNQLFRYYVIVGGMPDVVRTFISTHDIGKVVEIQKSILELYRQDIAKYAEKDKAKIKDIFDRIPVELNEKNKRFIMAGIQKSARMERYENSFLWLKDAGVALPCYNVTDPIVPLKISEKHNLFKLFMGDTGLLCASCLENVQFEILQNNLSVNMGSILENVYAQMLTVHGFDIRYFVKKNKGEIDFIIQKGKQIIPIEIKSGGAYKKHAALDFVLETKQWELKKGIVFCPGNTEVNEKVTYLPWYMIMFLKQDRVETGMIVNVDLSGL